MISDIGIHLIRYLESERFEILYSLNRVNISFDLLFAFITIHKKRKQTNHTFFVCIIHAIVDELSGYLVIGFLKF